MHVNARFYKRGFVLILLTVLCLNACFHVRADASPVATPRSQPTAAPRPIAAIAPTLSTRPSSPVYDWYDESTRYYYHQLTDTEKQLFSIFYDGIMNFEEKITVPEGFTTAMLFRVYDVIKLDCPEIFQITTYTYNHSGEKLNYMTPAYRLTKAEYDQHWSQIKNTIIGMRSLSGFSSSDYSKQYAIYQYIINHCYYQIDQSYTVYADSVYCYGRAQCCGYARALNLALRYYGIPCMEVTGFTYSNGVLGDPNGHEWSIVKIDGQWYHCDVTFDDPTWDRSDHPAAYPMNGNAYLKYFNVPDAFMLENRTMDDLGFARPACVSHGANYAYREGVYVDSSVANVIDYVKYRIIDRRDQGLKYIAIHFEKLADYHTVMNNLNDGIISRLKNAGNYRWWYDADAHFLYIIVP